MTSRGIGVTLALVGLAAALSCGRPVRAAGDSPGQPLRARGQPTQLSIPAIGLRVDVVPVGYALAGNRRLTWQAADDAVGWHRSSAVPGHPGNTVMSGHNASLGSGVFRDLHKVEAGDTLQVAVGGTVKNYVVTDRVVFPYLFASSERRAEGASWLGTFADERLTLITCYPWYTNTHRLVVIAHPAMPPVPLMAR